MSTAKELMKSGKVYFCSDEDLMKEQLQCLDRLYDFNQTRPTQQELRGRLKNSGYVKVGDYFVHPSNIGTFRP